MPFPDGAKTQDEATPAFRRTRLVRVRDDARIEQRRRLERIFMHKIGADQLALHLGKNNMSSKGVFHFLGTRLECLQQVAVATLKILKNIAELVGRRLGIERQDPLDDMVRPCLVQRVEVPRFGRWPERAHDHSRWIGVQI